MIRIREAGASTVGGSSCFHAHYNLTTPQSGNSWNTRSRRRKPRYYEDLMWQWAFHRERRAEELWRRMTRRAEEAFTESSVSVSFCWYPLIGNSAQRLVIIMSSRNYLHFCVQMRRRVLCQLTECYLMDHFNQRAVVWLNDNCYLQQTISAPDDNDKTRWANERSGTDKAAYSESRLERYFNDLMILCIYNGTGFICKEMINRYSVQFKSSKLYLKWKHKCALNINMFSNDHILAFYGELFLSVCDAHRAAICRGSRRESSCVTKTMTVKKKKDFESKPKDLFSEMPVCHVLFFTCFSQFYITF